MIKKLNLFLIYCNDVLLFIKCWLKFPIQIGATVPSGVFLSKKMADSTEPNNSGYILELGPGTGPVTKALIKKGIPEEKLILIEANPDFCTLLKTKFPKARIIHGDVLNFPIELFKDENINISHVVSSLPLVFFKQEERIKLIKQCLTLVGDNGRFIQFTYAYKAPIPITSELKANSSSRIWLNLWPAKVWQYSINTQI